VLDQITRMDQLTVGKCTYRNVEHYVQLRKKTTSFIPL
jgi:hypothetical protein